LANRDLRRELYKANNKRASSGSTDNTEVMKEILQLRQEKAELLGYKDYAHMSLTTKMVGSGRWRLIHPG